MTVPESEVKSCLHSPRSVLAGVLDRLGTSARASAMQWAKFGGALGTITGEPGLCAGWLLAATNIQWSNACVEMGLPATLATELLGIALPQPATTAASTKKAPSAV